ncbi:MAG: helix-turn-helix domain-containing protein [Candidatus Sumerlaeia bacterium]
MSESEKGGLGKMLAASDIAEYLNVSEHTVYRWCRSGKIPFYNLESTYRFDINEFREWLRSKHKPGAAEEIESRAGEPVSIKAVGE